MAVSPKQRSYTFTLAFVTLGGICAPNQARGDSGPAQPLGARGPARKLPAMPVSGPPRAAPEPAHRSAKPRPRPRTQTPKPATARRPARPPVRVLILGDSLMATDFGVRLQYTLNHTPGVTCRRAARSATGLARADVHDWVSVASQEVSAYKPQLVLVLIGSNDGQDILPRPRSGPRPTTGPNRNRVHWGKPGWEAAYQARVAVLLKLLTSERRLVLWLGLPPMRGRGLERKLAVVRKQQQQAVNKLGLAGHYVGLLPIVKELVRTSPPWRSLRSKDGVHFTWSGSRRLVQMLMPTLWPMLARIMVSRVSHPVISKLQAGRPAAASK